jgi:hypothetical protein
MPVATPAARPPEPEIWPVGYIARGPRVIVVMSDGTRRTDRDRELEAVEINSVTLSGKKLYRRPRAGSGVGATPVSSDGLPPSVAMRGQTGRESAAGSNFVGTLGASSAASPASSVATETRPGGAASTATAEGESSWYVDASGVSRLREKPVLGLSAARK